MTSIGKFLALFVLAIGAGTPVAGATLNEGSLPGGAFSPAWNSPTQIAAGYTTITGTGNANQFDNLVFTGLPSGAQTINIAFSAPQGIGWSYAAGGNLLLSTQPFRWAWDSMVQSSFGIFYWRQNETLQVNLGPSFSGPLYVALNFTYGANLGYTISAPSNVGFVPAPPPAPPQTATPVPLPGGAALLAAALGILGLRRRRA